VREAAERSSDGAAWTVRAYALYAAGAALAIFALAVRDPVPLFLALPLWLAPIAGLLPLAGGLPVARLRWGFEGGGRLIEVTGEFSMVPPLAAGRLVPVFYRPEPLIERAPPEFERTPAGLQFRLHYTVEMPCLAELPLPRLLWQDAQGLAERPVVVDGAPLWVDRYPPELHRLGRIRVERTTPLPGEIRSRSVGASGEFLAIRPYAAGDTVRQINWRATARAGRLLSNARWLERTGDILLLLDVRPSGLGHRWDDRLLAVSCAAALGIADAFLDQKSRVGLGVFATEFRAVPLGSGRTQRYRIREALRSVRMPPEGGPPERLAISVRRYFPPGVSTVLLSPMTEFESSLVLPFLRRRGFPTLVLSPSPLPLIQPAGTREAAQTARRLLRLVRREVLADAWREAPVIDWENYWSLAPLVRFLEHPVGHGARS
jgi:uncharacterized protein (DUF58 family)